MGRRGTTTVHISRRVTGTDDAVHLSYRPIPTGGSSKVGDQGGRPSIRRCVECGRGIRLWESQLKACMTEAGLQARTRLSGGWSPLRVYPVPNLRFILRCVRKRVKRIRRTIACHSRRMAWVHVGLQRVDQLWETYGRGVCTHVQSSCAYSEGW